MKKLLCTIIIISLLSCKHKQELIKPVVKRITESVYASGIIKSSNQYEVFSPVNGIIHKINISEGDIVQKGDILFTLNNETPALNQENARLAATYNSIPYNLDRLHELKTQINLAGLEMQNDSILYYRQQNLWEQNIGSRSQLEQRELAWHNSITRYKSVLLQFNELQKQIDFAARQSKKNLEISNSVYNDYIIKAKKDGRVYSLLKESGEMVNMQTPVAIIGDAHDFTMELQVDEFDIGKIRPGQKVFVSMDSYKSQVFDGILTKIDPIMNDRSRSFTVEARFTTQPSMLYPNLTVEANILISIKENALLIPRSFLANDSMVIVKGSGLKKVITGLKDYQNVEILHGLTIKESIIKPSK